MVLTSEGLNARLESLRDMASKAVIVKVMIDEGCDSPNECGGWRVISFYTEHVDSEPRENWLVAPTNGLEGWVDAIPANIGIASKFRHGTAFRLRYSEHGVCNWSLDEDGSDGVVVWMDGIKYLPPTKTDRESSSEAFVEKYTEWANGNCYGYSLSSAIHNEDIGSCWGYIGSEYLNDAVGEAVKGLGRTIETVIYDGEDSRYAAENIQWADGSMPETMSLEEWEDTIKELTEYNQFRALEVKYQCVLELVDVA